MEFESEYEKYCILATPVLILFSSSVSLLTHLRRSQKPRRLTMLTSFLLIYILYSIMNLIHSLFEIIGVLEYLKYGNRMITWLLYTPNVSELVTSFSGTLLALDRVLIMSISVKYSFYKINQRLGLICVITVSTVVILHTISALCMTVSDSVFGIMAIFNVWTTTKFLPIVLTLESLLHLLFCLQFRRYVKKQSAVVRKQTAQARFYLFHMKEAIDFWTKVACTSANENMIRKTLLPTLEC